MKGFVPWSITFLPQNKVKEKLASAPSAQRTPIRCGGYHVAIRYFQTGSGLIEISLSRRNFRFSSWLIPKKWENNGKVDIYLITPPRKSCMIRVYEHGDAHNEIFKQFYPTDNHMHVINSPNLTIFKESCHWGRFVHRGITDIRTTIMLWMIHKQANPAAVVDWTDISSNFLIIIIDIVIIILLLWPHPVTRSTNMNFIPVWMNNTRPLEYETKLLIYS